ncbi:MAG: hypothetical protein AAGB23_12535 [Pseudomonadota bacterium]
MVDTFFRFTAPEFYDDRATARGAGTFMEDARGTGEELAKTKRFARWFAAEMRDHGLPVSDPVIDEGGWMNDLAAKDGFVLIILGLPGSRDGDFSVLLSDIGSSKDELGLCSAKVAQIIAQEPRLELISAA